MHQLEKEIAKEKDALTTKAKAISAKRKEAAPALCKNIASSLKHLAMEFAELKIELSPLEKLGNQGLDKVDYLFKTNKGSSFLPIKKVASGGELSRLMLTILSLMSQHKNLPTLIFDEIDTGVSGEIAAKIANEFVKMGERIQLISITHLPQVAAKGSYHFHVSKSNEGEKTATNVISLQGEDRINELAKMISGEQVTAAAKENAIHLLNIS
jgi:DNA repair protein RecN (Recombination protein N)